MLGYHGHLDLAALYVKDGVGRISLREQDLIFLTVDDRFARADFRQKSCGIKPFPAHCPSVDTLHSQLDRTRQRARASRCFLVLQNGRQTGARFSTSRFERYPSTSDLTNDQSRRICELVQRTGVGEVPDPRNKSISTDEVKSDWSSVGAQVRRWRRKLGSGRLVMTLGPDVIARPAVVPVLFGHFARHRDQSSIRRRTAERTCR
jgi:hypothetical protein